MSAMLLARAATSVPASTLAVRAGPFPPDARSAIPGRSIEPRTLAPSRPMVVSRSDDAVAAVPIDEVEPDRGDPSVAVADHELVAGLVDRERGGALGRHGRDQVAGHEVVGPDLGPRGDVQSLAGPSAGSGLVQAPGFDGGSHDRDPEVARGIHLVVPECHDAARHQI